jgi:pilus assembly protein CpaE
LIQKKLQESDYELEYVKSGSEGLAKIPSFDPGLLIVDLKLPEMDGFEILERLRRDAKFSNIPVIVITAKDELSEKLKAFELGADDYLVKPFQPEELVARMGILTRRGKAGQSAVDGRSKRGVDASIIAVHSLRGGLGCSSIAVNLGLAFQKLWNKQTLLVDGVLTAGQIALMLNAKPSSTWENLVGIREDSLDDLVVDEMLCEHESGVRYIASPRFPIAADTFTNEILELFMDKVKERNDFIVVDAAHDFSDMAINMLNISSSILLVMAPEMASLRSTMSALEIYDRLGVSIEKVKVVLNNNSANPAIKQVQLEKVLKREIDFVLPYEAGEVNRALNFGQPFILSNPDLPICLALEIMAYKLSEESYKALPPAVPSPTWKRVTSKLGIK